MKGGSMNEHRPVSEFFGQDHDRLDELFKTFQKFKRSDFAKAKEAFKEFKFGLQRHIVWEEDILFPLWEEKTGVSEGGPTFVMRAEHRRIGQHLEAIHDKMAEQNLEGDQEEQVLLDLLSSHNMKEERVLYPSIDEVTTQVERDAVYRSMEQIPEDRYRVCGGVHEN